MAACKWLWFAGMHEGTNAHAADKRPKGAVPVRYNYPRPLALVPSIFSQRPAQRALLGGLALGGCECGKAVVLARRTQDADACEELYHATGERWKSG